jgi:hypothetical protein
MAGQKYVMTAERLRHMRYNELTVAFLVLESLHVRNARFIATVQREEKRSEQ